MTIIDYLAKGVRQLLKDGGADDSIVNSIVTPINSNEYSTPAPTMDSPNPLAITGALATPNIPTIPTFVPYKKTSTSYPAFGGAVASPGEIGSEIIPFNINSKPSKFVDIPALELTLDRTPKSKQPVYNKSFWSSMNSKDIFNSKDSVGEESLLSSIKYDNVYDLYLLTKGGELGDDGLKEHLSSLVVESGGGELITSNPLFFRDLTVDGFNSTFEESMETAKVRKSKKGTSFWDDIGVNLDTSIMSTGLSRAIMFTDQSIIRRAMPHQDYGNVIDIYNKATSDIEFQELLKDGGLSRYIKKDITKDEWINFVTDVNNDPIVAMATNNFVDMYARSIEAQDTRFSKTNQLQELAGVKKQETISSWREETKLKNDSSLSLLTKTSTHQALALGLNVITAGVIATETIEAYNSYSTLLDTSVTDAKFKLAELQIQAIDESNPVEYEKFKAIVDKMDTNLNIFKDNWIDLALLRGQEETSTEGKLMDWLELNGYDGTSGFLSRGINDVRTGRGRVTDLPLTAIVKDSDAPITTMSPANQMKERGTEADSIFNKLTSTRSGISKAWSSFQNTIGTPLSLNVDTVFKSLLGGFGLGLQSADTTRIKLIDYDDKPPSTYEEFLVGVEGVTSELTTAVAMFVATRGVSGGVTKGLSSAVNVGKHSRNLSTAYRLALGVPGLMAEETSVEMGFNAFDPASNDSLQIKFSLWSMFLPPLITTMKRAGIGRIVKNAYKGASATAGTVRDAGKFLDFNVGKGRITIQGDVTQKILKDIASLQDYVTKVAKEDPQFANRITKELLFTQMNNTLDIVSKGKINNQPFYNRIIKQINNDGFNVADIIKTIHQIPGSVVLGPFKSSVTIANDVLLSKELVTYPEFVDNIFNTRPKEFDPNFVFTADELVNINANAQTLNVTDIFNGEGLTKYFDNVGDGYTLNKAGRERLSIKDVRLMPQSVNVTDETASIYDNLRKVEKDATKTGYAIFEKGFINSMERADVYKKLVEITTDLLC